MAIYMKHEEKTAVSSGRMEINMAISKNITIKQIAAKANVSTATASRAINQPGTVKEETRNRVLQAMKELDFQIKRTSNKVILASFTDFVNPFYGDCIVGMQAAAKRRGYQLFLQQTENPENPTSYEFLINSKLYQGVVFCHSIPTGETLASIKMKYPVVMCSQYNSEADIPYVAIDDCAAAKKAINYLVSIGRKRIAFINSTLNHSYSVFREMGFREALKEAELPVQENWIAHVEEIDFAVAFSAAKTLLSKTCIPDAIFCASDVFSSAAVKAAHSLNLSIPEDVAVMGFDNVCLTTMTTPTISTVSQPTYQLGYQSCSLLIDEIEGNPVMNRRIILPTEIVVRSST